MGDHTVEYSILVLKSPMRKRAQRVLGLARGPRSEGAGFSDTRRTFPQKMLNIIHKPYFFLKMNKIIASSKTLNIMITMENIANNNKIQYQSIIWSSLHKSYNKKYFYWFHLVCYTSLLVQGFRRDQTRCITGLIPHKTKYQHKNRRLKLWNLL